ncbi:MAG: electron transport complex subunit RsxC [Candidatus Latescibacterota bacterium]|nr:MAG: electron transport complex subunit RsxC [Candidatus Latescibacterota bacterium]
MRSFRGGVHPPYNKVTQDRPIERVRPPERVVVPLSQHTGAPCEPSVEKGQEVQRGQKLGEAKAFISAPVHTPISGVVKEIAPHPHPVLGEALAVVVEGGGEMEDWPRGEVDPDSLEPEEIRMRVREAGVVGLGGAAFPTAVKLSPPEDKPIDTVILNGCECEPYLTADHRTMLERAEDCILGLKLVMRAVGAERGMIGVEANKPDAMEALRHASDGEVEVVPLKVKYPQGAEKMLIKAVLDREVPTGGLPMDVGVVVQNVGTAVAIAEAVRDGKPLIERVVTVAGEVGRPGNYLVPIGTPFSYLLEVAGGLQEGASQVVMGGPMMGIAQRSLEVPVVKGTSGVLALRALPYEEGNCIRCARCVDHCPMELMPTLFVKFAKGERWDLLERAHIMDCIECGSCAYVCPARIPIVHYIKLGKLKVRSLK